MPVPASYNDVKVSAALRDYRGTVYYQRPVFISQAMLDERLVLRCASVSFEEAAASLGARPATIFRRITMPLIAANLLAGAILTFSFSMLEVSDSLILAQKAAYFPITKAIYELSMLLGAGPAIAAALGLWTMVFLGISFLTAALILGKKLGAVFRG